MYRDSTEPSWNEVRAQIRQVDPWWLRACVKICVLPSVWQEFEIELEGSQTLRLLCYEKSCNKIKQSKEDGEMTDKIIAKGQIKVLTHTGTLASLNTLYYKHNH